MRPVESFSFDEAESYLKKGILKLINAQMNDRVSEEMAATGLSNLLRKFFPAHPGPVLFCLSAFLACDHPDTPLFRSAMALFHDLTEQDYRKNAFTAFSRLHYLCESLGGENGPPPFLEQKADEIRVRLMPPFIPNIDVPMTHFLSNGVCKPYKTPRNVSFLPAPDLH